MLNPLPVSFDPPHPDVDDEATTRNPATIVETTSVEKRMISLRQDTSDATS
jgi:hypothetical protein